VSYRHPDPVGVKHYFYYPNKEVKLRFEEKPDSLYQVIKLYGPIATVPDGKSEFMVPANAMHAGYFHVAKQKFILPGRGTEVA
jgi:hypothetical protein